MYDLTDINIIKYLLKKHGFHFSKSLGQNFLTSRQVVEKIACVSLRPEDETDCVLEIGPGIGTLTAELAHVYKKVVCLELDSALFPLLEETMGEYDNVEVIHGDILKTDIKKLISEKFEGAVNVAANLPYYITTPAIMTLLESGAEIKAMTLMIQKEVADRLAAKPGKADYGAITPAVNYYACVEKLFDVSPGCFIPAPKVTSTVIRLGIREEKSVAPLDEKLMFRVIKAAFGQRRKQLRNALGNGLGGVYSKDEIEEAVRSSGKEPSDRGETLSLEEFAAISDSLCAAGKSREVQI